MKRKNKRLKNPDPVYALDLEEEQILNDIESGKTKPLRKADKERLAKQAKLAARNTLRKNRKINLRITEYDYELAQVRAIEEGLPYQTLLASVIHKYLTGRIREINE